MTERLYRGLLHFYPSRFRARFGDDMVQLFGDEMRSARTEGPPVAVVATWLRALADLAATAASEHIRRDRTVAHSLAASPSATNRVLGLVGILGGLVLVVGFLPVFPWDSPGAVILRLSLFNLGAIAIVIAVHRRQASVAPRLALIAAVPAVLASVWYLAWLALSTDGRPFGLVGFFASVVLWLSYAAFGLVSLKLGVVTRWGALALAIGSLLAVTGIDRLGLTSTIFGQLSQVGGALSGIGWVLLGVDVATRRRALSAEPQEARPGG